MIECTRKTARPRISGLSAGGIQSTGPNVWAKAVSPNALPTLLGVDDAEVLRDLEFAVRCLADVHVEANVMLTRHHLRRRILRRTTDPTRMENQADHA